MKILQVTGELYPYDKGGLGKVVDILSQKLSEKGFKVTVLTPETESDLENHNPPYEISFYQNNIELWGNPISLDFNHVDISKFDIIHVHSHLFFPSLYFGLKGTLIKKPVILTVHGLVSQTAPKFISKIWLRTGARIMFNTSHGIICLSESDKEKVEKLVKNENIELIKNSVNIEKFKPVKFNKKQNYILFVGRLVPGKGIRELIDVFSRIRKDININLKIVGKGPLKNEIKNKVSGYGLDDYVEFYENISEEKIIDLYQKAKIFILPSYSEGLPLTILEAMACETPIICSNLPQLKNLVENCGETVSPGNKESLYKKSINLIKDKEKLKTYSKNARKKIESEYSWDNIVNETINLYKRVFDL